MTSRGDHPFRVVFQPVGLRVEAAPGSTLLDAAREAGVGITSECGGKGTCGRCRVRLDAGGAVSSPGETEEKHLGSGTIRSGMRLACQVKAYDAVTVTVPPESMSTAQRIQTEGRDVAAEPDPPTEIIDVTLPEPSPDDPRPDWERLANAIEAALAGSSARTRGAGRPDALVNDRGPSLPPPAAGPLRRDACPAPSGRRHFIRAGSVDPLFCGGDGRLCDACFRPAAPGPNLSDGEGGEAHERPPGIKPPGLPLVRGLGRFLRENGWRLRVGVRDGEVRWLLPPGSPALGLAVDIGTTKVAAWLLDLESGAVLASAGLMNAQIAFGEDVMSRIAAITENAALLDRLRREVAGTVNDLIRTLCTEASGNTRAPAPGPVLDRSGMRSNGPPGDPARRFRPDHIVECVVVGNTVMHHIFLGLPVEPLGVAPFTPAVTSSIEARAGELGLDVNENAGVYLPPCVSGFIGADHVAMMLASGARKKGGVILGVDVGTNTEISLVARGRAVSCSASSGPAFEGAHVEHGMRASRGAIEGVTIAEDGEVNVRTVGEAAPMGFCGSGVLDAVAELRRRGAVSWHGAIDPAHSLARNGAAGRHIVLVPGERSGHGRDITIGRKDIGGVQLAKAAIRSGVELLMKRVEVRPEDVDEVIVAGAFGATLNVDNAIFIGLFPDIPAERFRRIGNAAGAGARALLLSKRLREEAVTLAADLEHYELTSDPDFRSRFIGSLSLGERP